MAFNEGHRQILQDVTNTHWYNVRGQEDWLCSDEMNYQQATEMKDGFSLSLGAQLLPINNNPGHFRVVIPAPNIANLMDSHQMFFLPLHQQINNAKNVEEIIRIIEQYPGQMFSSGGQPLEKEQQIAAIRNQQNPNPNFMGKVTSKYGLEQKVANLIYQENQLQMQAQMQPQVQPQVQPPGEGMLKISEAQWREAEAYFAQDFSRNPHLDQTKMKKDKRDPNSHSFIKVGNEIYAMASRQCFEEAKHAKLGEGAFGKVKVVQARNGDNFAVKVEGRGIRGDNDAETKIGKMLDFVKGEAGRTLQYQKMFKNKPTTEKLYTVMQLKKGNELFKELYIDPNAQQRTHKFNETQKLIIALKACRSIDELHKMGIIHSDIKPENFISNVNGNMITVGAIDFGLSSLLKPGQQSIITTSRYGTPGYIAPEIDIAELRQVNGQLGRWREYSKASDVYALGVMLKDDLQLSPKIYEGMLNNNPNQRPQLADVMQALTSQLAKQKGLDAEARKVLAEFTSKAPNVSPKGLGNIGELMSNLLAKDITAEYGKLRNGKDAGATGWARARAKDVGGIFTGAGKQRAEQVSDLDRAFKKIQGESLTAEQKAEATYGYLVNLRDTLTEKTTFKSALAQMCDQYIKQIETSVGEQKTRQMQTNLNIFEKAKELQREIRPIEDKPNQQAGKKAKL
ncbi:protein kinase domain-containing protein [Candidatus Berkiella aquae]|uniref:Protein kinase n=1 Tax=Candidatus Berkiella aquae TaxID=295108 RepID=A0A0Q9YWV4_9GAMM|nr:protein kinase [Candidatus Berkiella aquae]MCS5711011.1 protein kinase [Candidatus Berkiella aquae]